MDREDKEKEDNFVIDTELVWPDAANMEKIRRNPAVVFCVDEYDSFTVEFRLSKPRIRARIFAWLLTKILTSLCGFPLSIKATAVEQASEQKEKQNV